MWIWKGNKLRSVEIGEICPDEILELSFEEDDLTAKHVRMQQPKTNLTTSQTGVSMASIDSSTSQNISERVPSSAYLVTARCKNNSEYKLKIKDSVELLGTARFKGGMAMPLGVFR